MHVTKKSKILKGFGSLHWNPARDFRSEFYFRTPLPPELGQDVKETRVNPGHVQYCTGMALTEKLISFSTRSKPKEWFAALWGNPLIATLLITPHTMGPPRHRLGSSHAPLFQHHLEQAAALPTTHIPTDMLQSHTEAGGEKTAA